MLESTGINKFFVQFYSHAIPSSIHLDRQILDQKCNLAVSDVDEVSRHKNPSLFFYVYTMSFDAKHVRVMIDELHNSLHSQRVKYVQVKIFKKW